MKNITEIKIHLEFPKDIQDDFLKLSLFAKNRDFINNPFLHLKNGVLNNLKYKDLLINYLNKSIDKKFIDLLINKSDVPNSFFKEKIIFIGLLEPETLVFFHKNNNQKYFVFKYLICSKLKN